MDQREPIFFAVTKSFLFGLLPALLTILDAAFTAFSSADTAVPAATLIAALLNTVSGIPLMDFLSTTPEVVHDFMVKLAPLYALVVGQQRMHAARPYTIDPRALK